MSKLALFAAAGVGAVIAAGSFLMFAATPTANCPTEDACWVDYHDGAWHIVEGERPSTPNAEQGR